MNILPSGLPEYVDERETLARFLTQSSHYNSFGVKPNAFLPNPKNNLTSVARHDQSPEDALWRIGESVVAPSGKRLHGAAFVTAADVRAVNLEVISEEPPLRHANLTNWSKSDDPDVARAAYKEIAFVLAEKATTKMRL